MNSDIGYEKFLSQKLPLDLPSGMTIVPELPKDLKPFQRAITGWALRRGRAALFEGTGLGKSCQELAWARAVCNETSGQCLFFTPLAVAEQIIAEAAKFGIDGVSYAADQDDIKTDIAVTNYERAEKFNMADFAGIVLDESGIIKSHDGKTRALLTEVCRDIPWKLCGTATPAPNDYTEFGQHAEFLGVMAAREMLSMFFVHDGSIRADDELAASNGWRLKRHAERDFWRWLSSWAIAIRHPRDLGPEFDDTDYDLPPLNIHQINVGAGCETANGDLFPLLATTLRERIAARKETVTERVAAAVNLVSREPNEPWLIWCNLNQEADLIEAAIPVALQVAGKHHPDIKTSRLLGFKGGQPPILVTKPSIAGFGMNWQHCARMSFVGLTDSFEQVYQAIRRLWRFGQYRDVHAYFICSEREGNVVANIRRKEKAYDAAFDAMALHMRDLMRAQITPFQTTTTAYLPKKSMEVPQWLTA